MNVPWCRLDFRISSKRGPSKNLGDMFKSKSNLLGLNVIGNFARVRVNSTTLIIVFQCLR